MYFKWQRTFYLFLDIQQKLYRLLTSPVTLCIAIHVNTLLHGHSIVTKTSDTIHRLICIDVMLSVKLGTFNFCYIKENRDKNDQELQQDRSCYSSSARLNFKFDFSRVLFIDVVITV
jgi:hypothetical protein